MLQGQIVDRPIALLAVILEGMADEPGAMLGDDGERFVRAAGIDDMDIVGDLLPRSPRWRRWYSRR